MSKSYFRFVVFLLVIDFISILIQLYFAVIYWTERGLSVLGSLGQFFSYYTILTNLVVCLSLIAALKRVHSRFWKLILRKTVLTAITVNIVFVGIGYNVLLRGFYDPEGIQRTVNEVLHVIIPILYLYFYYSFTNKDMIYWGSVFYWQLFPVIYAIYILIRGKLTSLYPYPFLDVGILGYQKVIINIILLMTGFLILSFIFIFATRLKRIKITW